MPRRMSVTPPAIQTFAPAGNAIIGRQPGRLSIARQLPCRNPQGSLNGNARQDQWSSQAVARLKGAAPRQAAARSPAEQGA